MVIEQPAPGEGYRVNVDSVHLARFAAPMVRPGCHVLDLGAGVGSVALCIASLAQPGRLTLVERDADSCGLARRNLDAAGWADNAEVVQADVTTWNQARPRAELVVMNPPYTPKGNGRAAKSGRVAQARQGDAASFVRAAALLAGHGATIAMSYPAHGLVSVLKPAAEAGLSLASAAFVVPRPGEPARLVLIAWTTGSWRAPTIHAPLMESGMGGLRAPQGRG